MSIGRHVEFSVEEIVGLLEAELLMLQNLLNNNREGFIKMAQENIRLHEEIAALKDKYE